MPHDCLFDLLSNDGPAEDVRAYCLIFYALFSGAAPEFLLIKKLILVLLRKNFPIDWILNIDQNP